MIDVRWWFDLLSAALWLALCLVGIVLRVRRVIRLHRIKLVEPLHPSDAEDLASVKRSTYLRLSVKVVLLIGALIALYDLTFLWPVWRIGIILALVFMVAETVSVDHVWDRLGRAAEAQP